ncbi:MAG TPA: ATP-binding protein [Solirubrobacteraceae bacterium]|jgi:serine/threonine-protein kinase RsbW|nr:ATP-binding protein [Solirubrobacteraceae bacterium]
MTRAPNVRLGLVNLPENVSLVREVLAGLAGAVPLDDGLLDDVKTVVSEACNNVVLHAYDGAPGPLDVEIRIAAGTLEIAVRDSGCGIRPRLGTKGELQGIGIPVIHALSDRVEFTGGIGEGTEVRMFFDVPGARELDPAAADEQQDGPPPAVVDAASGSAQAATLIVAPISLARSVLSRPLTALAARARFSIDRLSDLQLVTDAITAHAGRSLRGGRLQVGVLVATRDLELRIGPLRPGMASQLIGDTAVAGLEPLIETLADEVTVESFGDADVLTLRLLDSR